MKKRITAALMTLAMIFTLSACGGSPSQGGASEQSEAAGRAGADTSSAAEPQAEGRDFSGTEITVLCPETPYINTLRANIAEFTQQTGIEVTFDQYANDQLSNKIAVSSAAGGEDVDVFLYRPIQENLAFIDKGWLEKLDAYIAQSPDFDYQDYTEPARAITSAGGETYGIPLVTEREIVQFNKEMLSAVGYDSIPATYDAFVELCDKLKAAGYTPLGLRGEGNAAVTQFSGFLYGFGGDFIDQDTKTALIDTDEFVKALQFYGRLCREYSLDGVMNAGWQETSNWFTQGQVAMRVDADSQYGYALNPDNSLVWDKVGHGVLPGASQDSQKPYSIVAWACGIGSGSTNKEACWEFIKWAGSKEMDMKAQKEGNFSARNSTWADADSTSEIPADLVKVIEASNQIAAPYDRPYMINAGEARTLIGELITKAIEGIGDEELMAACKTADEAVQKLLDSER